MDTPEPWQALCRFLGVPERLARAMWTGLRRVQWSEAAAVRLAFLLYAPEHVAARGGSYTLRRFPITGLTAHAATPAKLGVFARTLESVHCAAPAMTRLDSTSPTQV
jgi:hypothetical protein